MGLRIFYVVMGVLGVANGIYMLGMAEHWYHHLPAEIPDTGPFNGHFIRDIGLAYTISGLGFIWSAIYLAKCRIVHMGNTLFLSGHAALHVVDIVSERLPLDHVLHDALGVFVPGIIMLVLCIPSVWARVNPLDFGR
jgi:hypothetical protein